ncbi:MAG: hypothetical protein HY922_07465 [Elusimicrobia bacterium]|nr:hypothetical protein [Elusimicrobiota bacterium]
MNRLLLIAAASSALLLGCANPPRFVKKTPALRLLYRPRTTPFLGSPMFTFDIRRTWLGPKEIPGGARYLSRDRRSAISVAFHAQGSKEWKPPEEFRRTMRESGSVEDRHILISVEISSRPAQRAGFTTYSYDPEYLLGVKFDVLFTDIVLVPDPEGIFVAKLETPKPHYPHYLQDFLDVLHSLSLRTPKQMQEQ